MKKFSKIRGAVIQLAIGALVGVVCAEISLSLIGDDAGLGEMLVTFVAIILSLAISFFLHIIIHEGGHLVTGLISGYKFVSFRIGSLTLMKEDGKFKRKKFSIPGTGGQCLLDPPGELGEDYPCVLYNLGGGLANTITGVLAILIGVAAGSGYVKAALVPFGIIGISLAFVNLFPMKVSGISNDGYNIKSANKDLDGKRSLWLQLRINALEYKGVRLKNMPEAYFDMSVYESEENPLVETVRLIKFQRLLDEQDFAGALELGHQLLHSPGLLDINKNMLRCDMMFLELIGPCRPEVIERIYTKEIEKYFKMYVGFPSVLRTRYAYAVRFAHDEELAKAVLQAFEKLAETYPAVSEIESERELFKLIG